MKAQDILEAAAGIIDARSPVRDDGDERSMARTVEIFNAATRNELTEAEGWLFLAFAKIGRSQQGDLHMDDYIDAASYIALSGEAAAKEVRGLRSQGGNGL